MAILQMTKANDDTLNTDLKTNSISNIKGLCHRQLNVPHVTVVVITNQ